MSGPIILALDGMSCQNEIINTLRDILYDENTGKLLAYVKINDAAHFSSGNDNGWFPPNFISYLKNVVSIEFNYGAGIFLDLKLADTNGTNVNIINHYKDLIDILTVRESVSARGWLDLRRSLGAKTKLALVSVLTDMTIDECQVRYGMLPAQKIANDIINIKLAYSKIREENDPAMPFDMVVCSPLEVKFLSNMFGHELQFIVPGIRDAWMTKGQQERFTGVRQALNSGATYCVMGAQMMKGNPKKQISPKQSRNLTMEEVLKTSYSPVIPGDPLATLVACGGFYESPKNRDDEYIGPLVAYAGKYETPEGSKNYVGHCYFNIAKAEENPIVRGALTKMLQAKIERLEMDVLLGMPMGGIVFATELNSLLNCRLAFAEKKITRLANSSTGTKEESDLVISRHEISPGNMVFVFEDVCNNFSTTAKAKKLIEEKGGIFRGIICMVNRSNETEWDGQPVISLIHKPSPQYKQDNPKVADLVNNGGVVWKPKYEWPRLKAAMGK